MRKKIVTIIPDIGYNINIENLKICQDIDIVSNYRYCYPSVLLIQ